MTRGARRTGCRPQRACPHHPRRQAHEPHSSWSRRIARDVVVAAGIRADQSVDAVVTSYTVFMMVLVIIALRLVNPTQLVTRVREEPTG